MLARVKHVDRIEYDSNNPMLYEYTYEIGGLMNHMRFQEGQQVHVLTEHELDLLLGESWNQGYAEGQEDILEENEQAS